MMSTCSGGEADNPPYIASYTGLKRRSLGLGRSRACFINSIQTMALYVFDIANSRTGRVPELLGIETVPAVIPISKN